MPVRQTDACASAARAVIHRPVSGLAADGVRKAAPLRVFIAAVAVVAAPPDEIRARLKVPVGRPDAAPAA